MRFFATLVLSTFALLQDGSSREAEKLIEQLRSGNVTEREQAEAKLRGLGDAVLTEVLHAARSADPETAARASRVVRFFELRKTLPKTVLTVYPNAAERLSSNSREWTLLFLKAAEARKSQLLGSPLSVLRNSDLDVLVEGALRGAESLEEMELISELT